MIIPSLRTYFSGDIQSLRKAIFIGTFIPLICYIVWDMVILGIVPLDGAHGLKAILNSSSSNGDLISDVSSILNKETITLLAKFFTSICMATSFLSISLCLSDFLSDGFKVPKKGRGNILIFGLTFLPPLILVLFYPGVFIRGLNFAGISCLILMVLLPPLMVWFGRYHHRFEPGHTVKGGKFMLSLLVIFAAVMIGFGLQGAV